MGESKRAWLRCPTGPLRGDRHEITDAVTIGRTASHDIALDHRLISSDHARIAFDTEANCFVVEDLGSTNGTRVDGVAVGGRTALGHLHVITFADVHDFVFLDPARAARRHGIVVPAPTPRASDAAQGDRDRPIEDGTVTHEQRLPRPLPGPLAAALAEAAAPAPSNVEVTSHIELPPAVPASLMPSVTPAEASLPEARGSGMPEPEAPVPVSAFALEVTTPGGTQRFPLFAGENLLGRGREATIRLSAPQLSRRHAVLEVSGPTVRIRDLGSRHRTHFEGHPIEAEITIEPGDQLRFGTIEARLVRAVSKDES